MAKDKAYFIVLGLEKYRLLPHGWWISLFHVYTDTLGDTVAERS